jgi:hypothetical protein
MPAKLGDGLSLAECDKLIRAGNLEVVLQENDRRILRDGMGLSNRDCQMLKSIWDKMRNRRLSRRRNGNGKSKALGGTA